MSKHKSLYLLSFVLILALLLPGNTRASVPLASTPQTPAALPHAAEPLPDDCDGVAPPGACCIFGYAYFEDIPTEGITVTVESLSGSVVVTTTLGPASMDPYYRMDLSSPPLSVEVGDPITITAEYQGMSSSRGWTAQPNGQQVDLGLIANPKSLRLPTGEIDWLERAPMPIPTSNFGYAVLNGQFYVIGGAVTGVATIDAFQRYTFATDTWEVDTNHGGTLPPLPQPRGVMVAGAIHGKIHAVGGWDQSYGYRAEHYVYDPDTNAWTTADPIPLDAIGQFGATFADKLYIFGGFKNGYRHEVYEYAEPGGWTLKTNLPTARNHGTTAVYGNTIYVIGGQVAGGIPTAVVESYQPLSDTWTTGLSPMPAAQHWLGSSGMPALAGLLYVFGPLRQAYQYNPQADAWQTLPTLPANTYASVEAEGSLYTFGPTRTYQGVTAPWPGFAREEGRSGRSPYLGPQSHSVAWTFQAGQGIHSSPAIGSDETTYFGSENGKLYAVGNDGDFRWAYQAGGGIRTGVAIGGNGNLYFGSLDHKLYALSSSGSLLWTFTTGNEIYGAPAVAPNGNVYFTSYDGLFYALRRDGTLRCSYTVGASSGAPAIGPDGVIYVTSGSTRRLYALNPDCSLKWESDPAANAIQSGAALSPNKKVVYYGSDDGHVYARYTADGSLKWQSPWIYGGVTSTPAVGSDGIVYATTMMGALWALDPADGSLRWDYPTNLEMHSSPVIGADGVIYFATAYGYVFAVNPDGSEFWTHLPSNGDGHFFTSPAIGRDGKLYLGSSTGKLFVFGDPPGGCGERLAPWVETASLLQPVGTHGAGEETVVFDGRVYAFGGRTTGYAVITDTYVSGIQPNGTLSPWHETTPLPGVYFDHSVVRLGKYVYFITGADGSTAVFYAPILPDGEIGAWTSTAPLNPTRQDFATATSGEYVYVVGGNASGLTNKVWFTSANADGTLSPWSETTSLPEAMQDHTAVAINGYLYALTINQSVYYAPIQPDGTLGTWLATTSLPQPTSGHTSFALDDKVYVLAANSPAVYQASVQSDGSLSAWIASANLPAARSRLYAGGRGCFAYAVGGYEGGQYRETVFASRLAQAPAASFSAMPLSGPAPLTVAFSDRSTGDVTTWDWTFGDGQISGARFPEIVYTDPGDYAVSLHVAGPGGSDELTRNGYVHVGEVAPPTPPIATLDYIWYPSLPGPAVQGEDVIYFGGSGVDTDEGGGTIISYTWQSSLDGFLSDQANFTMAAADLSAGTHTIYFQVGDDEGYPSEAVTATLEIAAPPPEGILTLILVNRQQLEALYGATAANQVVERLNLLAAHPNVRGQVLQLGDDPNVATAYAAWNADPASSDKANAVTAAIKAVVNAHWAGQPALRYLVIVGDDRALPFRRVADLTNHPESLYTEVPITTTVGAALHADMTLSDDFYGDFTPTPWNGHDLYLPDLGIGRLVETPAEIVEQINVFLGNSSLSADTAGVTGYEAVRDSATAICHELGYDGLAANCSLVGGGWGRSQFVAALLDARRDLVSVNGHATHYTFGTPSDDVYSSDVIASLADLTQSLFYSMGCHAGLNVPPATDQALDFPQAFASQRAAFIGNTGFGWSQRSAIGLSEQLMLDFTERLVYGQSATVGRALAAAKREYYLNEGEFDIYDEKILIEATLYGLPMTRYETPEGFVKSPKAGDAPNTVDIRTISRPDGLTINHIDYQFPPVIPVTTEDGVYYTFGGLAHTGDSEPIQPKYTADISFPQTNLHGVVFRGGAYADIPNFNPVIEQIITDTAAISEPTFTALGWYPTLFYRFNELGMVNRLVTQLGQFNPKTETERLYDRLSFDIYYHDTSSDWEKPSITAVMTDVVGGTAAITVTVSDNSSVEAVVIAYTDNRGAWASVELVESGGQWVGEIPVGANTEFFVQAVDSAGNVAVLDAGGVYFHVAGTPFKIYLPLMRK